MFYIPPLTGMFYFSGCASSPTFTSHVANFSRIVSQHAELLACVRSKSGAGQLRFTQLGFPIRKSSDRRLLRISPRHIAATLRPSSPFDVKASTMCPYANHPNADLHCRAKIFFRKNGGQLLTYLFYIQLQFQLSTKNFSVERNWRREGRPDSSCETGK